MDLFDQEPTPAPNQGEAERISRILIAPLASALLRIEQRVCRVEGRVLDLVPRRGISDLTKRRHAETILALGGRCPCCCMVLVVNEAGPVLDGAEFDHWWSRERHAVEDTWFLNMSHARRIIETWQLEYNTERPHSSLGDLAPEEYAQIRSLAAPKGASLTADSKFGSD